MTAGHAANPHLRTRLAASPVETILAWMQGRTVAQGWDVVCAVAFDKINEWFLEQYVDRLSGGENELVNGSVTQSGGIRIQAVDLALGPPLITFSKTFPPNYVGLTVNFLSGRVDVVQADGEATTVLSSQTVTPGDDYVLTGVVPLASVQGEVENGHDVVIDIVNGSAFSARLALPEGAETLLGQFLQEWLVNNLDGYQYKLGTLIYSDTGSTLRPAGTFQFATQLDAGDPTDTGRLLLFIPTTYNPGGGAETALGLADIVPKGCSTALIISSKALFGGILKSFYENTFSAYGVKATAEQPHPSDACTLTLTAGDLDLGEQSFSFGQGGAWAGSVFSGRDTLGSGKQPEHVVVPLTGVQLQASSNQVSISARLQWPQDLAIDAAVPHSEGLHTWGTITVTATVSCQTTAAVTAVTDDITLKGTPGVSVSFDASGIADSTFSADWNALGGQITAECQTALSAFFDVPLPDVNAFAVSNLLFPGQNILDFQSVYVPGDLVVFGDVVTPEIVVSPGSVTLAPGQTQLFSATTSDGEAVTWCFGGTKASTGLYTAPATISSVQTVQVKAIGQTSGDAGAALVTLVPRGVQISPTYALMLPNAPVQQFSAAVAGAPDQKVTWSLEPPIGTLDAQGRYTPPATVPSPQAVKITATSTSTPSIRGSALVTLFANLPAIVAVTPFQVPTPLTPGQTQQFTATAQGLSDQSVRWSLLPAVGEISSDGLYTAPDTVAAAQPVLVVATSTVASVLYGTALIMLAPGE